MLDEYEAWKITMPTLPRPSPFYHLAPIGLNTPMVESLTGYIVRLADAHCVSVGILYAKAISTLAPKGNIFTFRVTYDGGYPAHNINGNSSSAADFVRALETLTSRQDLRYLTLLSWAQVLPPNSLLRRSRAWCESCLWAWREAGQQIYEPLLWALQMVTVCPYHRCSLCQLCPYCNCKLGPLDPRTRPGHCSRCGSTLLPKRITSAVQSQTCAGDDMRWAIWTANALGELLAAAPQICCSPQRTQLAETIRLCIDHTSSGNASAFARVMKVGVGSPPAWQKGRTLPRLGILLDMAYRRGMSLLELLCESSTAGGSRAFIRPGLYRPHNTPRLQRQQIDTVKLSSTLQAALKETPPPSLARVIKRLPYGKRTIRRYCPTLCRKLVRRRAEYLAQRGAARKVQAAEEVRRFAYDLQAKGIQPTRQRIRSLLSSPAYLNLKEGSATLRVVRHELNL